MEHNNTLFLCEREELCLDWIGIAFNTCLQLVFNGNIKESSNHIWGWVIGVLMEYFTDGETEVPTAAVFTPNLHFIIDPLELNHMQCEGLFKSLFENFMDSLKRTRYEPNIFDNNYNESMQLTSFFIVINALILLTSIIILIYVKITQFWEAPLKVQFENTPVVSELKKHKETVTFLEEIANEDDIRVEDEIIVKDEINVEDEKKELDFIPLYLNLKEEQTLECEPNLSLQIEAKKLISLLERPKKTQNPLIIKPLKLKSITNIVQPKEMNLKISKASLRHSSIPLRSKTMDLK